MIDERQVFERVMRGFVPPDDSLERLVRRRDRKRRNQRIAAGVVGIAVFVAAIWIVTSGGVFERSETSVVPGGDVTGPAETGPAETGPPPAPAFADVTNRRCSDGARSRLALWKSPMAPKIGLQFEVRDSPPGHLWHIRMWRSKASHPDRRVELWRGAMVASDSGDFGVLRLPRSFDPDPDGNIPWVIFRVEAIDSATGQVCEVIGSLMRTE